MSQYDTGTRTLQFKIQNDGVDFTIPSGITASIEATKKDLTGFSYPCTISGNTVSVVVQPQMTVFPGKTMCEIVFKQGNDRIGTANFWLKVEDAALNDSTIISETDIPGIANLSEAVQTAVESAESAEQDALDAEAWAVGTRDGVAVESTDPTYHNNSKYYSETFEGDVDRIEALVQQAEALAESIYSIGIVESASGDPASFADGASNVPMKSVSVGIEPKQDLDGYEYPWVGGAGKNLFHVTATSQSYANMVYTVNSDGSVKCSRPSGGETTSSSLVLGTISLPVGTYRISGGGVPSSQAYMTLRDGNTWMANVTTNDYILEVTNASKIYNLRAEIQANVSPTNILYPMIRLASVTDDTFAPYSNICPISGWDEVKVTRTGVNVWDEEWELGFLNASNGQKASSNNNIRSKNYIPIESSTSYLFYNGTTAKSTICFYAQDKTFISALTNLNPNTVITTPTTAKYMLFGMLSAYGTTYGDNLGVNYPSTDTDYSPYAGQTYPISLTSAGTVYGGTLDVATGELVVDRKMANFDGTESWGTEVVQNVRSFYLLLSNANKMTDRKSGALYSELLSNEFVGTNVTGAGQVYVSSGGYLNCRTNNNFTDVETWKSFLASNPLQVVYPLATPLTYTLTPTQITSLLGVNHIWADCGEISCEYVADTKMYIQNLLASQG